MNELEARRERLKGGLAKRKEQSEPAAYEKNGYMDDDDETKGLSGSYSTAGEKKRDEQSTQFVSNSTTIFHLCCVENNRQLIVPHDVLMTFPNYFAKETTLSNADRVFLLVLFQNYEMQRNSFLQGQGGDMSLLVKRAP